jgi:hypothetical protein
MIGVSVLNTDLPDASIFDVSVAAAASSPALFHMAVNDFALPSYTVTLHNVQ